MRRAAWGPSPDEPKGAFPFFLRWLRAVARGQDVAEASHRTQSLAFVAALMTLPVIVGSAVLILLDGWTVEGGLGWVAGFAALAGTMRIVWRSQRWLFERPLGALERILPLPLPEGTFPVYVAVRFRSALTGVDEAAASFVDGWLHVEGARTSFSLRDGDGRGEWDKGRLRIAFPDGVSVVLWAVNDRAIAPLKTAFEGEARRWIAQGLRAEGESLLPPLGVHPSMRRGWRAGTIVIGLLVLAAVVAFVCFPPSFLGIVAFVVVVQWLVRGFVVRGEHVAAEALGREEAVGRARGLRLPSSEENVPFEPG